MSDHRWPISKEVKVKCVERDLLRVESSISFHQDKLKNDTETCTVESNALKLVGSKLQNVKDKKKITNQHFDRKEEENDKERSKAIQEIEARYNRKDKEIREERRKAMKEISIERKELQELEIHQEATVCELEAEIRSGEERLKNAKWEYERFLQELKALDPKAASTVEQRKLKLSSLNRSSTVEKFTMESQSKQPERTNVRSKLSSNCSNTSGKDIEDQIEIMQRRRKLVRLELEMASEKKALQRAKEDSVESDKKIEQAGSELAQVDAEESSSSKAFKQEFTTNDNQRIKALEEIDAEYAQNKTDIKSCRHREQKELQKKRGKLEEELRHHEREKN